MYTTMTTALTLPTFRYEIGVDEAGRGPLMGPVYAAAVVLPLDEAFDYSQIKDSKRFSSKKKLSAVAQYIKTHAIAWSVMAESAEVIDDINILQATQSAMHKAILDVHDQLKRKFSISADDMTDLCIMVDGNYFKPLHWMSAQKTKTVYVPHQTVIGGDGQRVSIAAASILAKAARDEWVAQLCQTHPELVPQYGFNTNMGYGTAAHLAGIRTHGLTEWHRKSFKHGPAI